MATGLDIAGTTALVAGGTGGLGREIVAELSRRGSRVITAARTGTASDTHILADLRSADDAGRVVEETILRTGRLDIVVNAVGVVAFGDAVSTSVDAVEELFLTNTFVPIMIAQESMTKLSPGES